MTEVEVIKKKRGRKPKNFINLTAKTENNINNVIDTNSEDEKKEVKTKKVDDKNIYSRYK